MSFYKELKRRNVIRVAAAYIVTAWLIMQVADVVLGNIDAPGWVFQSILLVLVLGLPLALLFAWAFELTPQGLKRESEVERSASITPQTGRKLDRAIIVILAVALGYFAWDKFASQPPSVAAGDSAMLADKASIAVLPFVNMSSDPEQDYFSDGISEELLNLLAQIPQFQVAGRTSSFQFKGRNDDLRDIGESLGVSNILEGSVRKGGDQVRITAQLIKARDGFHLWSDTYDRKLDDVFKVQDEIANSVVNELKLTLLGAEVPDVESVPLFKSTDAHNDYLQGLYYMNRVGPDNSALAAEAFARAVKLEPRSALAWASLADAKVRYAGQTAAGGEEALAEGREAAARAFALDPQVPEVHIVRARIAYMYDWDWQAAEDAIQKALALRPGDIGAMLDQARLLATLGRTAEAIPIFRELIARDPLNGSLPYAYVTRLVVVGEWEEAENLTRRLVEQDPQGNFNNAYYGWVLAQRGRLDEGYEYALREPLPFVRLYVLGIIEHLRGHHDAADAYLHEIEQIYGDSAAYQLAGVAAYSGDADRTMDWLERAYEARDPGMTDIKTDIDFRFLHDDPRFVAMLRKMNLAD